MSNRGMTSGYLTAIQSQQIRVIHLLEFHFSSTVYLTDAGGEISWNSHTYEDTVGWISADNLQDSFSIDNGQVAFTFSGAVLANYSLALSENFSGDKVVLYRALLDTSYAIIADPLEIFTGYIDSWEIREDAAGGNSKITWNAMNHWANFDMIVGRRTNSADQQNLYSGDTGLDYADQATLNNLKWPS